MLFSFVSFKLKFLWSSTNQHGVHSPFVYNYITKCLYKKKEVKGKKSECVVLKSIPYFKVKSIHIHPNDPVMALIREHNPEVSFNKPPYDLVFMDISEWSRFFNPENHLIHNNTLIIVYGLYQNKAKNDLWKQMIKMPEFNLSMDLFYCGVLCIRREQRKEHFKVRI